jgi:hypothetical protein
VDYQMREQKPLPTLQNVSEVEMPLGISRQQPGCVRIAILAPISARAHRLLLRSDVVMEVAMELHDMNPEAVLEIQQMLDTPIEHQASQYELSMLGVVLGNALQALQSSESDEETCEVLSHVLKSAFVIGRRHVNRLI